MKNIIFFLCIILAAQLTFAQTGWEAKIYGGYLISHHPEMQNMESHISGIELHKYWTLEHPDKRYNGMKVGLATAFFDLGKDRINGSSFYLLPNIEIQLNKNATSPFSMRWGAGIGYISNPFSFPSNVQNKAVGTHLNGTMQMLFSKSLTIGSQGKLSLGFGLTHMSNANFKKPNLGINTPHLFLNYNHTANKNKRSKMNLKPSPKGQLRVVGAFSKREISLDDPKAIQIFTLSATYLKKRKTGHFWRFGTDVFYDRSYSYVKFEENSMTNSIPENTEHGVRAGYHWKVSKVGLLLDMGIYTYRPSPVKRRYYTIVGMDYAITPKVNAFVKMKTHLSVADFFLWGLSINVFEHE